MLQLIKNWQRHTGKIASGEIMAYYIILQDEKFVYSLLGGSPELGKKLGRFLPSNRPYHSRSRRHRKDIPIRRF